MPNGSQTQETRSIQSLDRGLAILEAVAKSTNPVSLGELTGLLGIDRSSVFRLANTLKRRGFLAYPGSRKDYILGPSLLRLSREYDWSKTLILVSHDHLRNLAASTNETAHLAAREGKNALFIDHVVSSHVIVISGQTGELVPLYATAHGKALLTDFDKRALSSLLGSGSLRAWTGRTCTSVSKLADICEEARSRGFSTDDGEYQEGIRCVAAPIRNEEGVVIGSIGISAPALRFSDDLYHICGEQVLHATKQIETMLRTTAQTV
jgi:IclR family acetate operon transcriptional repressor